jgi:hypothetical protein
VAQGDLEALGDAEHVHRQHQLVRELRRLRHPRALPDREQVLAHALQDRPHPLAGRCVARDDHGERPLLRAGDTAADRRVDDGDASPAQVVGERLQRRRIERAHADEREPLSTRREQALLAAHDRSGLVGVPDDADHGPRRLPRHLGDRGSDLDPDRPPLLLPSNRRIEPDHPVSGPDQVRGHRATHRPQPEESDDLLALRHDSSSPLGLGSVRDGPGAQFSAAGDRQRWPPLDCGDR